jgi:hypothetical protein
MEIGILALTIVKSEMACFSYCPAFLHLLVLHCKSLMPFVKPKAGLDKPQNLNNKK